MSSVKLLTFKTGQTIISQLDESDATNFILKCPVNVVATQGEKGPMLGFVPFLDYSQEFRTGIKIDRELIMTVNTPVRELENEYSRVFGSGIEIASNMPKI